MTTIVLATGNTHKVQELTLLFNMNGWNQITLVPITSLVPDFAPVEDGENFETNAYIKAQAAYAATGLPALADDSGLEIDALDGAPGVYSARFSGDNATDASNRAEVRRRLEEKGLSSSVAAFRCVLCLVTDNQVLFGEGACTGTISIAEKGDHGFGYDSMFTPDQGHLTFAELTSEQKARHSHRAMAVADLVRRSSNSTNVDTISNTRSEADTSDLLVEACVLSTLARWSDLQQLLQDNIRSENNCAELYEVLLQTYLFAGYPVALEALSVLHTVATAKYPHLQRRAETFDEVVFRERGLGFYRSVYGSVADKMQAALTKVTPDLADWMIVEGYGKTLSRPGVSPIKRELCVVAVLATQGHMRQLTSHIRGAALLGATRPQIERALAHVWKHGSRHLQQEIEALVLSYSAV
ncbi:MAG: RdgB/HAM1 family non-canonical purine NTP pyrophosphatase [Bradyrhizobiaceae bacterium]|nr:RdgB/HAM1 family non-canonical purine NTP pyrophosphatase [Bradyrhizobiaceae bacterium]